MAARTAFFSPLVALTLNDKGEATKLEWDWADSYNSSLIDLQDEFVELGEDEEACALMDTFIIDNNELMRWV